MRKMKKLLSVLVAATMTLAMAAPSFAAPDTPVETPEGGFTITINNENSGHTYEAYQIFKGDLAEDENGKKILSNIGWGSGVNERTDDAATVAESLNDQDAAKEFAQNIGRDLSSVKTDSVAVTEGEGEEAKTLRYEIRGLEPGYYLVKDANGSLDGDSEEAYTRFILAVVDNTTATPKSSDEDIPKFDKTVGDEKKGNDYNIGDHVPFTLKATIPSSYADYTKYTLVFKDELSSGLTFDERSVKLLVDEEEVSGYTPVFNGQIMTLSIEDAKQINAIAAGSVVSVSYTATLNEKATAGTADTNKATLEYSNNPNSNGEGTGKTVETEVKVYTFKLALTKVADYAEGTAEEAKIKLPNAEFTLKNDNEGENKDKYAVVENGKITGWDETGTTLISDENGLINVDGLDAGIYTLKETKAPAGYNLLADSITLEITSTIDGDGELTGLEATYNGDPTGASAETGVVSVEVMNNSGAQLPSTGGIGTTIFYAAGIILMAGAVFFVVRRKRA